MAGISASISISTANINFTSLGGADYLVTEQSVALGDGYKKSGGGGLITVSEYDPSNVYTLDQEDKATRTYSGTDADSGSFSSIWNARLYSYWEIAVGGYSITLPAGTGERTAKLAVMAYAGASDQNNFELVCTLSDSSASYSTDVTVPSVGSDNFYVVDLTYSAASDNQTLTVQWRMKAQANYGTRAVHFGGAWVSNPSSSPVTITCAVGAAAAAGNAAIVGQNKTINGSIANGVASGYSANVYRNVTINGSLATANAVGYQALIGNNVTISSAIANAVAQGYQASITISQVISGNVAAGEAVGYNARINTLIQSNLLPAVANGFSANVYQNVTLSCSQGNAVASGNGSLINRAVACSPANASANGNQANVLIDQTIQCTKADGVASSPQANVRLDAMIYCNPANGDAQGINAQINQSIIIQTQPANANANGNIATLFFNKLINCAVGIGNASGFPLSANVIIPCQLSTAVADGTQSEFLSDRRMQTQGGIAVARGYRAFVSGDGIDNTIVEDDYITFGRRLGRR